MSTCNVKVELLGTKDSTPYTVKIDPGGHEKEVHGNGSHVTSDAFTLNRGENYSVSAKEKDSLYAGHGTASFTATEGHVETVYI
jgi:hypothetical protein